GSGQSGDSHRRGARLRGTGRGFPPIGRRGGGGRGVHRPDHADRLRLRPPGSPHRGLRLGRGRTDRRYPPAPGPIASGAGARLLPAATGGAQYAAPQPQSQSSGEICAGESSGATGSCTLKVVPSPSVESTVIAPPSALTKDCTIDRPSPEPPEAREREPSGR